MSYLTINEINNNPIYAPIGDDKIKFIRRINLDKIKNIKKKYYNCDEFGLSMFKENGWCHNPENKNCYAMILFHHNAIVKMTDMYIPELKKYLKQNNIKNYSKLKKPELIKLCMSF